MTRTLQERLLKQTSMTVYQAQAVAYFVAASAHFKLNHHNVQLHSNIIKLVQQ